jgi:sirohydrochlorin ferrochelatase
MQSLLIISHGSRKETSNNEIFQLESNLRGELADHYPIVVSAFLEFAPQSIPNAIKHCVEKGATNIRVLPYFLAAGVHVTDDIPAKIKSASEQYSSLKIEILPHLGSSKNITRLIGSMLTPTGTSHAI